MDSAKRRRFLNGFFNTFGFQPNKDNLRQVRPAVYEVAAGAWGYVYIGELAHVIGTTPLELIRRFWPLDEPGMVHHTEMVECLYLERGLNQHCGVDKDGVVSGVVSNKTNPGYVQNTLHPRMLVSAGWSQRVIKAYNAGVASVKIENLDHHADCPAGTVYCCKARREESPEYVPLDIVGVGRTEDGAPYDGPILWHSLPSKMSRTRHSRDICGND